ncbi:MAG TPA: hypothetical protein VKU41_17190, partial [Polyangiaceae bacterium]|nr:hypothetical protein [Polyangiaceae bacterium]
MIAFDLGATRVDEALRVVRALGAHRYVASSLHLVHAFAFAAADASAVEEVLGPGGRWARAILDDPSVDASSRDERLWRRSSAAEVVALLGAFWTPGPAAQAARSRLREMLDRHDMETADGAPFDESAEDDLHPLAIDAGWELLPLARLDAERHRGVIAAYGEPILFESARFEEETAHPAPLYLCELPAVGPVELLRGVDDEGRLAAPLVAWVDAP